MNDLVDPNGTGAIALCIWDRGVQAAKSGLSELFDRAITIGSQT
jgi:hypothetical protein